MRLLMTCNGRENALGVDRHHIRLSFDVKEERKAAYYEFQVSSSKENLINGIFDVGMFSEEYAGNHSIWLPSEILSERTRYYWQVAVQTDVGIDFSRPTWFETGPDEWSATWITGKDEKDSEGVVMNFKREFEIQGKITSARLYICGLGYFDAKLNGQRLDDIWYKPQVTDYAPRSHPDNPLLGESMGHRVTYYTYDVTKFLMNGENALEIDVADGYFKNVEKIEYAYDFSFGIPRLIYELHFMENGIERVIRSDSQTFVRKQNYRSLLYRGDVVDATMNPGAYGQSVCLGDQMGRLVSPICQDDRIADRLQPCRVSEIDGGVLYDFGVNHTGGLNFTAEAKADGAKIHICYAEVLNKDGRPNYETSIYEERMPDDGRLPDTHQQTTYILKAGRTNFAPLFSWKCYRYAWIKTSGDVSIDGIESLFIHMDVQRNGSFKCSDAVLENINEMFVQTVYCNLHSGLLTDCPHREKRPYTGDGNLVMRSVFYNLDAIPYFYKWFEDMEDARTTEGRIPNTVPNFGGGGGFAWGNAICTLTKELYHYTGDMNVIQRGYPIIKGWLDYYAANRDDDYIIRSCGGTWLLGDWLATDTVESNVYYINTACYYIALDTAKYLAGIIAPNEVTIWQTLQQKVADGINRIFFNPQELRYGYGKQGEDVLALALRIVPEKYEPLLRKKVEKHYREETDYHIDTGIVLTPILINYLSENGYRDIAYRMMTAQNYPSYYTMMENETTFCEHWSKKWPDFYLGEIGNSRLVKGGSDLSHCHPMYGSIVSWLYEKIAGLDLTHLYQKQIYITPYFTDYLRKAKACKETAYGRVSVEWENTKQKLKLRIRIPENLSAILYFPSTYIKMRCSELGLEVQADSKGYFNFTIPSGNWLLETDCK